LGNRAAGQLGLKGAGALAYANELVTANLENQTDANILLTLIRIFEELRGRGYGNG
jgi:hypothetical protein